MRAVSVPEDDSYLKDSRYVRWQGMAMAQFTVAIALMSGLAVSTIGAGISLLQQPPVSQAGVHSLIFAISMLLLVISILLTLLSTISRTLDFRLTARKVRGRFDHTMCGWDDRSFGRASWCLFWAATASFVVGVVLFVASVCTAFALQTQGCK